MSSRSLVHYRTCLMFWCLRTNDKYKLPMLHRNTLFFRITEVLRYAAQKHGLTVASNLKMSKVGLAELRQLIDYDMTQTPNIAVAEAHHLAWCLGRICAVRPGSLGISSHKHASAKNRPFLTWRDIEITRGSEAGRFQAQVTFRNLKTNVLDPEKMKEKGDNKSQLCCIINSPRQLENLDFSCTHMYHRINRPFFYLAAIIPSCYDGDSRERRHGRYD